MVAPPSAEPDTPLLPPALKAMAAYAGMVAVKDPTETVMEEAQSPVWRRKLSRARGKLDRGERKQGDALMISQSVLGKKCEGEERGAGEEWSASSGGRMRSRGLTSAVSDVRVEGCGPARVLKVDGDVSDRSTTKRNLIGACGFRVGHLSRANSIVEPAPREESAVEWLRLAGSRELTWSWR